ncbi:MAG: BON domain-containing protein [Deltaproteobacteria bacterium]|jgi:osmotically-inducible protein OsmY
MNPCRLKESLSAKRLNWILSLVTIISVIAISSVFAAEIRGIKDIDITLAVDRQLQVDEGVPAHLIDVRTKDGIVTLSGPVENLLSRERAAEIAATVKGVRAVINLIDVLGVIRTDAQIRTDVEHALLDDPATDVFDIDANVHDGVVTLSGMVDSWQEEHLCELVTKGVIGVKAVNSNIRVSQKAKRPDDEIKADIERGLAYDVWIDDDLIDVKVLRGHVILSGTVGSLAEKTRTFRKAWVAGVTAVEDKDLRVNWSELNKLRRTAGVDPLKLNDEIKQALKDVFAYDPRISRFDFTIEVDNGFVTLTGKVDNLKARRVAEQDARNTRGVWVVNNRIKVRPGIGPQSSPMPDVDAEIARRVRVALLRNPNLYQHEISVSVRNRAARLSGRVDSAFEKSLADDVVSRVKGVTMVMNNLTVNHSWTPREDWIIKKDIENELWWSPFVDADDVSVTVSDGVATLAGVVDTLRERRVATENAYEGGARDVRNELKVRRGPGALRP